MCPVAQSDGHDAPGLLDEPVPGVAAVVEDVGVGAEDPVRQPVLPHELPDGFDRVELRRLGGQRDDGDVLRHLEPARDMPAGLVEEEDGVSAWRDRLRDLGEVERHRLARAAGEDEPGALAICRADRAEDVGGLRALILRRRGPRASSRPAPGDLVLLPHAGLVGEPDLYAAGRDALIARDRRQTRREGFLKAVTAASSFS